MSIFRFLGFFFLILAASPTIALDYEHDEMTSLRKVVDYANEFDTHRTTSRIFPNLQSDDKGVQIGHVNTADGSLSFAIRDLVVFGDRPIVFSRVYDSSIIEAGIGSDFGDGWVLGVDERIFQAANESYVLRDETASVSPLEIGSSITKITKLDDKIIVRTNSLEKTYRLSRTEYLLETVQSLLKGSGTVHIARDAHGQVSKISSGDAWIELHRNGDSRISGASDNTGRTVSFGYSSGKLTEVTDLGGSSWIYKYEGSGRLNSITTESGVKAIRAKYDKQGRVRKSESVRGSYKYKWTDNRSVEISSSQEKEVLAKIHHDSRGHVQRIRTPSGSTTKLKYRDGVVSNLMMDDREVFADLGLSGSTVSSRYRSTNGNWKTVKTLYDQNDRKVEITENGKPLHRFVYSPAGALIERYDLAVNRTVKFDMSGRITSLNTAASEFDIKYDDAGRVFEVRDEGKLTSWYEYYDNGSVKNAHVMEAATVEFQYDERGLLKSVKNDLQGETSFHRNDAGSIREAQTQIEELKIVERQSHDDFGRVEKATSSRNGNPFETQRLKRNPRGDVVEIDSINTPVKFNYDDHRRLLSVSTSNGKHFKASYERHDLDIRTSHDRKGVPAIPESRRFSISFPGVDEIHFIALGNVLNGVVFVESMMDFVVLTPSSGAPGDDRLNQLVRSRMLVPKGKPSFMDFVAAPSNSATFPAEYYSVNCITIGIPEVQAFAYTMFIPYDHAGTPGGSMQSLKQWFGGDNRNNFSGSILDIGYRAQHLILVTPGISAAGTPRPGTAKEHNVANFSGTNCIRCTGNIPRCYYFPFESDRVTSNFCRSGAQPIQTSIASNVASMQVVNAVNSGTTSSFVFTGAPKNPLAVWESFNFLGPSINYTHSFTLTSIFVSTLFNYQFLLAGIHDGFPAHQLHHLGSGAKLYDFDPRDAGNTPSSLYGQDEETAAAAGIL